MLHLRKTKSDLPPEGAGDRDPDLGLDALLVLNTLIEERNLTLAVDGLRVSQPTISSRARLPRPLVMKAVSVAFRAIEPQRSGIWGHPASAGRKNSFTVTS
jgi:hypothetical protein